MTRYFIILALMPLFAQCVKKELSEPLLSEPFSLSYDWRQLETTDNFSQVASTHLIQPRIDEVSGICPSLQIENTFWTHQDSGSDPKISLLNDSGKVVYHCTLFSVGARDYEDISNGPGPEEGNYIYLADIGDNMSRRTSIKIYRFKEPKINIMQGAGASIINHIQTLQLLYPTGATDAEALSVDPLDGKIYIFTKTSGKTQIFSTQWTENQDTNKVLHYEGEILLSREKVTASDISPDGTQISIKTYEHIYNWSRPAQASLSETLQGTPYLLPYFVEAQGEAFCWGPKTKAYYTLSEFANSVAPKLRSYHQKQHS